MSNSSGSDSGFPTIAILALADAIWETIPIDDEWYVSWNRLNGTILNSDSDAWMLEHITTRGQLRLLLRALS